MALPKALTKWHKRKGIDTTKWVAEENDRIERTERESGRYSEAELEERTRARLERQLRAARDESVESETAITR